MDADLTARFSRQTMLSEFGTEGQQRLCKASALIVGLGGLGSPVATYLACTGVGHLGLADPDTVSLSNLQRQVLYTEAQIGEPKTLAAAMRLSALRGDLRLTLHPEGLTVENARDIIPAYDLVVDCTDNFATRYLIDDVCAHSGVPWVHGAIGEFGGQLSIFNHRDGRRYADLHPDREALCAIPRRTSGVLGPVPGVLGALQASEAIKILSGMDSGLEGKLFTIDLLTLHTQLIEF